jgi:hypothetical protein
MANVPAGILAGASASTGCRPVITKATSSEFELINPLKPSNFIIGELVGGGELSFILENLPKTTPQTGCPGQWMFRMMMAHFGSTVTAIQGNWFGRSSDNLATVNQLTSSSALSIEDAAQQTWTGMRAKQYGYSKVQLVGIPIGTPGNFTTVQVLFTR